MIAFALGVICGIASWPLTYAMGYRFENPEGIGRIVGIPFMVAFFDSRGRDYIGSFMMFSLVGNAFFWFLVPSIALALYGRQYWKLMK